MSIKLKVGYSELAAAEKRRYERVLVEEIEKIKRELEDDYNTLYASMQLPEDERMQREVSEMAKRYGDVKLMIVVGIGGSNLGTMAVQEALLGKEYNLSASRKIFFADTVDTPKMTAYSAILENALKRKEAVLIDVVSKSGSTTETIANAEVFLKILQRNNVSLETSVVFTTDHSSKLWNLGQKLNVPVLEIPKLVGGRYSVFSPVGLFPLQVLGINTSNLIKGAKRGKMRGLAKKKNPAMQSAIEIFGHYKKKCNIEDTFVFASDLEAVGKWYRQLMGESVGKEYALTGKKVHNGMTPTVSVGSTDLHSMAQLYLGGPYDKHTSIITARHRTKVTIPRIAGWNTLVEHIQGKSLDQVMGAIVGGVEKAFKKGKRPFQTIELSALNEESIGELLQMKMIEMIFLGKLMNVNPFDQPNVEAYKKETRNLLSK